MLAVPADEYMQFQATADNLNSQSQFFTSN